LSIDTLVMRFKTSRTKRIGKYDYSWILIFQFNNPQYNQLTYLDFADKFESLLKSYRRQFVLVLLNQYVL